MTDLKGKNITVSILTPFKNEEVFLEECIRSILDQTFGLWELILVNDHSTDRSPEIARNFSSMDARIRYLANDGHGVIHALRTGLKHSTGHLITRMDADDIKTPDNLQQLVDIVRLGTVAVGKVQYFRDGGIGPGYKSYETWLNALCDNQNHFKHIYKECVVPSPCWMMYKQDLKKIGAFDSDLYPEDYDLSFRMYQYGLMVKGTSEVVHFWRDHSTRSSRTLDHYSDNRFFDLKSKYFFKIARDESKKLVLMGAGKKGKYIAKNWLHLGKKFSWVTSNPNKVGHIIYGVELENSDQLEATTDEQIVVAVSGPQDQVAIRNQWNSNNESFFWFC